jgi:hypothetical protein
MHAALLAAALAVGSGDKRDGATDGSMVEECPLRNTLRAGASEQDIRDLLGPPTKPIYRVHELWPGNYELRLGTWYYDQGRDVRGRRHPPVWLDWDEEGRLKDWGIRPWSGGFQPAR